MFWRKNQKRLRRVGTQWVVAILLTVVSTIGWARVFELPAMGDDVVGKLFSYQTHQGENFFTIAKKFDVGYFNLIETNPGVNPTQTPPGTYVLIPNHHILPNAPREDIVINLAEMRVYFYPPNEKKVYVYPVGIGREETRTPLGYLHVIEKRENPVWISPKSVREARAKQGVIIPKVMQPGPDNPLGHYAIRLSLPTYLIHGTNDEDGVGRRSSAGCIRMFNDDVKALFGKIHVGTNVLVINQPVKIGRSGRDIFLEVHLPLHEYESEADLPKMKYNMRVALRGIMKQYQDKVDWRDMERIATEQQGVPQMILKKPEIAEAKKMALPKPDFIVQSPNVQVEPAIPDAFKGEHWYDATQLKKLLSKFNIHRLIPRHFSVYH